MKVIKINKSTIYSFIFVIWTVITIFIVKDIVNVNKLSIVIVIGYVIFLLLSALFGLFKVVLNARNIRWLDLRKRLLGFIKLVILFSILPIGLDYLFRRSEMSLERTLPIAFGLAAGASFYDLVWLKKKKE